MLYENKIWVGTGNAPAFLLPQMANRHGLIAGATGTGKTVSLKVLAEGFSQMGVPVFLADVKGDLAGMVAPGQHSESLANRLAQVGVPSFQYQGFPTVFWDVYGEKGHPVRATVSEMGPLLLARMLGLNETQTGVLNILFRVADDEGMLLLDIKDLKAMLAYLGENSRDYTLNYGNVSAATIGAIQRAVIALEDQGGDKFFGEPALNIADWMQIDEKGQGVVNILAADKLMLNPTMYSTFLLWMLSELYELLPEQGDLDKPRMVFFFDEAHLLFNDCPKALMDKIEQVVRLIRSKGVGVYFITQNPADVPMNILTQLGNRIQHCLRAYTPLDQRGVKAAADTFRTNPAFDTAQAITLLKTGEALVSFLDESGAPSVVEKATILPPQSFMGAIDDQTRQEYIQASPFNGVYDEIVDRQSAYEVLSASMTQGRVPAPAFQAAAQPVQISTAPAQPVASQGFMVFDPATGQYVNRQLATMPAAQAPAAAQPLVQPQSQMPVLVYNPVTGQYTQQMMPMQYDPATGSYTPAMQPQQSPVLTKEQKAAQKEAQKAQKEQEAAARRKRNDE
ncbi:MAG: DUF853 family protein, partial [Clostridia bacterium]|nr:DUF853 family protein [Clostridia bacterium]